MNQQIQLFEQIEELFNNSNEEEIVYDMKRKIMSLPQAFKVRGIDDVFSKMALDIEKIKDFDYIKKRIKSSIVRPRLKGLKSLEEVEFAVNNLFVNSGFNFKFKNLSGERLGRIIYYQALQNAKTRVRKDGEDFVKHCDEDALIFSIEITDNSSNSFYDLFKLKCVTSLHSRVRTSRRDCLLSAGGYSFFLRDIDSILCDLLVISLVNRYLSDIENAKSAYARCLSGMSLAITNEKIRYLPKQFENSALHFKLHDVEEELKFSDEKCYLWDYKRYAPLVSFLSEDISKFTFEDIFPSTYAVSKKDGDKRIVNFNLSRYSYLAETLMFILSDMIEKTLEIQQRYKMLSSGEGHYASPYSLKRNIPTKIKRIMDTSSLLKVFPSLELDELTDLKKFSIIEREILKYTSYFKTGTLDGYTLRFRRLGKQRAGGIYYPTFLNIVIDISTISSFVHEFFHLLDYRENIDLTMSDRSDFVEVANEYKRVIESSVKKLDKTNPIYKKFYSSSKYNKSYYFDKPEIFARCGEIYITHILGYKSSLCKSSLGFFLPTYDDKLIKVINDYFEEKFGLSQFILSERSAS